MKRTIILSAIVLVLIGASVTYFVAGRSKQTQTTTTQQQKEVSFDLIAAPGRVEPISEEIEVGAEIPGKIKEIKVEEGERVQSGQILAVLVNDDYAAQVASAKTQIASLKAQKDSTRARLEQSQAELRRVINGTRIEERREAKAAVEQADAALENAQREVERRRKLSVNGDIPREELERAEKDLRVAKARRQELNERFNFINAEAREEDIDKAKANVSYAESSLREIDARLKEAQTRIDEAQARLEKTFIRSPISGVVLRKRMQAGESLSPDNTSSAIFTIADTSVLRVRVDVDETDVAKIREGQKAYVMADAYGDKKFTGRVVRIGQVLGKKNIRTDEPKERVDTKILEALIELDAGQTLPTGLRVDAYIMVKT
jgi:ABC exporter DevB family membrane fusion protein